MYDTVKYDALERKTFESIGEYIYTFENLLKFIKEFIELALKRQGLNDERLGQILTFDSSANSILNYYKGFLLHLYSEDLKDKKTMQFLVNHCKRILEAVNYRNDVAHAHWFVTIDYDGSEEYVISVNAEKNNITKDGFRNKFESFNESQLDEMKERSKNNYTIVREVSLITNNYFNHKKIDSPKPKTRKDL